MDTRKLLAVLTPLVLAGCGGGLDAAADGPGQTAQVSAALRAGSVDVIVSLRPEFAPGGHAANRARASAVAAQLGLDPRFAYGSVLFGFATTIPERRLAGLARDPRVAYVDLDGVVSVPPEVLARPPWAGGGGGSTAQTVPWGIARIGADTHSSTGAGVHVYVLDTGIDSDHPDLAANLGNGFAVEACKGNSRSCRFAWDDDHDHGTHVAGTIGALDNSIDVVGVAPQVTLHAVKVLAKNGSGTRSGVIAGIDWVADETAALGVATVINMSLGGAGSKTGTCTSSGFTGKDAYHQALCNAKNGGVLVAAAAGNSGADAAGSVPAAYDDAVLTVSATSQQDDWPSWSNWGDDAAGWTSKQSAPVAIAAPGVGVLSTRRGGGTTSMSGTSMAAPHVAGALALFLEGHGQQANGAAFTHARGALLWAAESTAGWENTSGETHAEDFLRTDGL